MLDFLRGKFVRTDRSVVASDSTADNIVAASAAGKVPLNVQGITGSGVDAFKVYAAGGYKLQVDSNGMINISGSFKLTNTAITGAAGTLQGSNQRVFLSFTTSSAGSVTLPAISALTVGQVFVVQDVSGGAAGNNITVTANAADSFNGGAGGGTKVISTAYGGLIFVVSAATKWNVYTLTPA